MGKRIRNNRISRREFLQRAGVGVRTTMLAACMPKVFWAAANRFVLGVSTSIFPGEVISVEEYALLGKSGINSVEIGYEHSGPALLQRGFRDRLFTLIKDAHTPVYSLHAPYMPDRDISALDEKRRHMAVHHAEEALELANQLGAKLVTIHGSQEPISLGRRADRCAQARKSLGELAAKVKSLNLRLALETMPPDWLPSNAAEALDMVEGLDSDVVGFCLDTNHSNLTSDLTEIIQALSPRIWNVHLSDNDGLKQQHWMPFKGIIDWKTFMEALHETNYAGPLHYELDPDPAGPEKCLKDIKQNFNRLMNLAPKKTRKQKTENNIMYVSLFFDVEDCVTPISDDIAKDLADIVSEHGLKGDFMVVGDKARTLMERGRSDVIESLRRHEIGLHTNRHSRHPNVAEYLEDKRWSDGIDETVFRESPGVKTIEQIFGKSPACWGQSGGSWAPQAHPAMKRLGIPIIVYPETHTQSSDVHWYGGILTFSYRHFLEDFDQNYSDDTKFEKKFQDFKTKVSEYLEAGFPWTGVFCAHPITVRAYEFGDALNFARGKEAASESWKQPRLKSEAEYQTALKNFAVLVKYIATHPRLRVLPVGALKAKFGRVADEIGHENLISYAEKACRVPDIPTDDPRLSPAEAVDVLVKAILALSRGANPKEYDIRHVDGPVNIPPEIRSTIRVTWDVFRSGCESAKLFIDRNGHLPASIDMNGASVGIGSFYHTACESFGNLAAQKTLKKVAFRPGLQIPSIAKLIAKRTEAGYRGWIIHKPDLNVTNLLELTRLQTWTLKPAAF